MSREASPAQMDYCTAVFEANEVATRLPADRRAGLAVATDIGVSAAFMFGVGDREYRDAAAVIRQAIAHATRESE